MDAKRLAEIRQRAEGRTAGPLNFHRLSSEAFIISMPGGISDNDINYFVHVIGYIPFLLDEIERLNKLLRFRVCSCGWTGREFQTLDYKHETGARMCPECHEPTEVDEGE